MSLLGFVVMWLLGSEVTEADAVAYLEFGKRGAAAEVRNYEFHIKEAEKKLAAAKKAKVVATKSDDGFVWMQVEGEPVLTVNNKGIALKIQKELKKKIDDLEQKIKSTPKVLFTRDEFLDGLEPGAITIPLLTFYEVHGRRDLADSSFPIVIDPLIEQGNDTYLGKLTTKFIYVKSKERLPTRLYIKTPCRIDEMSGREIKLYLFTKQEIADLEEVVMESLK